MIAVGVLLLLVDATEEWGFAFWGLAVCGLALSELIHPWLPPGVRPYVLWTGLGIVVLGVLGALAVGLVLLAEEQGMVWAGGLVAALGVAGVVVGLSLDLGLWLDPVLDIVSATLIPAGATLAVIPDDDTLDYRELLAGGGLTVAIAALTSVITTDPAAWLSVLLGGVAAFGCFAVTPLAFRGRTGADAVLLGAAACGGAATFALIALLSGRVSGWWSLPVAVLMVAACTAAAVAYRLAWRITRQPVLERPELRLASYLADLATRPDQAYRLLPHNW
ncbi:hypothetical protein Acsp05_53740 [Actinokineospora sp. NBRC 105648]|nr:hypothetical protein Acsp05_53740 [Actinokineospora sp. NBRC 105648]